MIFFFILCIVFLLMLIFPIGIAMISKQYETKPLFIRNSNTKNPRYFADSFKKIFNIAWKKYDGTGILHMSREEKVIEADKLELQPFDVCDSIVYSQNKDFSPCEATIFEKEIYVKKNAQLKNITAVRAIACEGDLTLNDGTKIIRWADSEGTLKVYNDCDLGISTSSGTKLIIGKNCCFKRLYAPLILLGKKSYEIDKNIDIPKNELDAIVFPDIIRNIKYVDDEIVDEQGILKNTIITKYDIKILSNCIVQGDICSHKDIKIDDNAIIHGNVFAEGNIFIGMNVSVLGVVFSQENIYVEDGAIIGQMGKIKSIVARGNILFGSNCCVYGYIGTEEKGKICPNM